MKQIVSFEQAKRLLESGIKMSTWRAVARTGDVCSLKNKCHMKVFAFPSGEYISAPTIGELIEWIIKHSSMQKVKVVDVLYSIAVKMVANDVLEEELIDALYELCLKIQEGKKK